jgi:hypothetical protein
MLQEIDVKFYHQLSDSDQDEWLFERSACDQSFYYFTRQMGGYLPKSGGDLSDIIHKPICDWWQDNSIVRKFCYMPRDWRKTTVLTRWVNIWRYLKNPEVRILIASQKLDKPIEWIKWMEKIVLTHERLRWQYPILLQVDRGYTRSCGTWSQADCLLPRTGHYPEPTWKGIGITGAVQGGHYDFIHPDDMIGEKGMESATVMEDALRWFDNIDELLDQPIAWMPNPSIVTGVGTHWAQGDQGTYIQANYREYKWKIVPAIRDSKLGKREEDKEKEHVAWVQDPNVADGESNWGEWFPTQYYKDFLANPEKEMIFYCQHQNNPSQSGGGLSKFDPAWLRYFRFDKREDGMYLVCEDDKEEFQLSKIQLYGMIDPGGFSEVKAIKAGSRNASVVGGQPYKSVKKFIVHAHAARFKDPDAFMDPLFEAHEKYRPRVWRIDTAAQQKYIYRDIQLAAKKRGIALRITPLTPDTRKDSKDDDIQSLIDPFFNGEFYIHRSMKDFVGEYSSYPTGFTKDILDCVGKLHVNYWTRKERREPPKRRVETLAVSEGRSPVTGY